MSCYLYYKLDINVYSDYVFDSICRRLYKELDTITHVYKHLVSRDNLKASTGYDIVYPTIVKHASKLWYLEHVEEKRNSRVEIISRE